MYFAKKRDLIKEWLRRIGKKDLKALYVGVCSKHFRDDDFVACSKDTNKHRKRSSPSLKKRYLKADAIPSIFPEVSGHFPAPVPARRSGKATFESRLNADIIAMHGKPE